jgi:hypothetical protein
LIISATGTEYLLLVRGQDVMKEMFSPLGPWGRVMALALTGAPYLTPTKVLNAMHCEWEVLRREVRPRSRPYVAVVDAALIAPPALRGTAAAPKPIFNLNMCNDCSTNWAIT